MLATQKGTQTEFNHSMADCCEILPAPSVACAFSSTNTPTTSSTRFCCPRTMSTGAHSQTPTRSAANHPGDLRTSPRRPRRARAAAPRCELTTTTTTTSSREFGHGLPRSRYLWLLWRETREARRLFLAARSPCRQLWLSWMSRRLLPPGTEGGRWGRGARSKRE